MRILVTSFLVVIALSAFVNAKTCLDMTNKEVKLPEKIQRVFSITPPTTSLLYALSPEKLIGVNYEFYESETKHMLPYVKSLPVLGGIFGGANQVNTENILALKPDLIFMWSGAAKNAKNLEETFQTFNIPIVYINQNNMNDIIDSFEAAGACLGEEKRAKELTLMAKENLELVKNSVEKLKGKKKRVFMADGVDGLVTECKGDLRSEALRVAGGINVHECSKNENEKKSSKRQPITIEQLYKYDPDVIIVRRKEMFDKIFSLPQWQKLRAVNEKEVYYVPISPFSWIGRPPSFMRFIGVIWLHKVLYPEHFHVDLNKKIKEFFTLFLKTNLSDEDIVNLLKGE